MIDYCNRSHLNVDSFNRYIMDWTMTVIWTRNPIIIKVTEMTHVKIIVWSQSHCLRHYSKLSSVTLQRTMTRINFFHVFMLLICAVLWPSRSECRSYSLPELTACPVPQVKENFNISKVRLLILTLKIHVHTCISAYLQWHDSLWHIWQNYDFNRHIFKSIETYIFRIVKNL